MPTYPREQDLLQMQLYLTPLLPNDTDMKRSQSEREGEGPRTEVMRFTCTPEEKALIRKAGTLELGEVGEYMRGILLRRAKAFRDNNPKLWNDPSL